VRVGLDVAVSATALWKAPADDHIELAKLFAHPDTRMRLFKLYER